MTEAESEAMTRSVHAVLRSSMQNPVFMVVVQGADGMVHVFGNPSDHLVGAEMFIFGAEQLARGTSQTFRHPIAKEGKTDGH